MRRALPFVLLALLTAVAWGAAASPARAQAGAPPVPPALEPWRGFVLHGAAQSLCPPDGGDAKARICLFPASLDVALDATGADFTLQARLFDLAAVPLPSGGGVWIEKVVEGGKALPVVAGASGPAVWLGPGEHVLAGRLGWNVAPGAIRLPESVGLVTLSRRGAAVPVVVSASGELSLAGEKAAKPVENTEQVKVFRLLADGDPATLTTLFRLEVSGLARSVTLAGAVPPGALALAVRSPVPATLGPDGSLVLDAGPGRYEVEATSRFPGKAGRIGPAATPYGREVWSYRGAPQLRETRLEGAAAIDPKAADVPAAWRDLPAFTVAKGANLDIRELGRGAPPGRDALTLSREMWLDMSGQGLSVRDAVTGENRSRFTLSMAAPGELGRVVADGRDQPVVLLGREGERPGVELRTSRLTLTAYSRYPDAGAVLPAGGFDREFDRVSATLHLAPGWALLFASGPDTVRGGLLSPWTLLDVFLALALAVAAFSLRGPAAALALGLFLLLSWHEPDAPRGVWVLVLVGLALLRLAGDGGRLAGHAGARRLAGLVFGLSLVCLVVVSLPFVSGQLRGAVAPQVAPPSAGEPAPQPRPVMREEAAQAPAPPPTAASRGKPKATANMMAATADAAAPGAVLALPEEDPDAVAQTGPAMPDWRFATASLAWKGPVAPGEGLRLYLVPPLASRLLHLARALLLGAALLLLCDRKRLGRLRSPTGAVAVGMALTVLLGIAPAARAGDFPDRPLLDLLRERLTEPPACLPHCLGSPSLEVRLEGGRLTVASEIDAAARLAAPLPAVSESWRPDAVTVDGAPGAALVRSDGTLKVLLEAGRHTVVLSGPAPAAVGFTVTPALAPGRVRLVAPGYRVRGLDGRGGLSGPLELTRAAPEAGDGAATRPARQDVPPFFEVRRVLRLGLAWEVETEIVRRSPADVPAVAKVALLPGEHPDAAGVTVTGGQAEAVFPAGRERLSWRSRLTPRESLELIAPSGADVVEAWELSAAPFYDVTFAGVPPVGLLGPSGAWQPRFAPWPGEKLAVSVSRPKAAPGETLTLERVELTTRQGRAMRESRLALRFRAAKGARHAVTLPPGAEVTRLAVAGRETLPTGEGGQVGFSLPPGVTEVELAFREPAGLGLFLKTPAPDPGLPAASAVTRLELPEGRWLLAIFADTFLGPAVLYWGYLAVVAALGLGLSMLPDTLLTRRQWLFYALGLSQAEPVGVVLAVAWLAALGWRRRSWPQGALAFDAGQVGLVALALAGFFTLYDVLGQGLLGLPRMQVAGPGVTTAGLAWTWDRVAGALPAATVVSAPMAFFRALMLAWAAWLAWSLPRWLRLGFESLTAGGGWRPLRLPRRHGRDKAASDAPGREAAQPHDGDAPGK
ncbi:hypothetical protein [Solidesulfovibrio sp.]|uniref:hypothetical protein n=1 Tax=Solidesulfovibrio sp. TaxID=2910990 RepID=UPI00263426FD|nr:hypothetical protein [Solidesulfovibrio sp.]